MADEKLRELVKKAEDNIIELFDNPEKMSQYLELLSKNNQLTYYAASMFMDNNSYVDTYDGWKERGYQVKSGEHGTPVFLKRKQIKRKFIDDNGVIRDLATANYVERQKIQNGDLKLSSDLTSYYVVEHLFSQEQTTAGGISLDIDMPKPESKLSFGHIQAVAQESANTLMDGDDFVIPNSIMDCAVAYATYMLYMQDKNEYDRDKLYEISVSNIDELKAKLTLSEKKLVLNYALKITRSEYTKELLEKRKQEVNDQIEEMKSKVHEDKKIKSTDVTDLKVISRDFDNGTKEETYTFECNVSGTPNILTYIVMNEKYGATFSIHTEDNDIWDSLENATEIEKLQGRLSEEAAFYTWGKRISEVSTADELLELKYAFLETENIPKKAAQRIGDVLDKRDKEFEAPVQEQQEKQEPDTEKTYQIVDEPEKSAKQSKRKIQDFGKKIGGAKKDLWKERGLSYTDLEDMNFAEKNKYATKNYVFPKPDYQKLVDEGMPVKVAYFIKIVRDALPTKPTFEYFEKDNDELATKKIEGYVSFVSEFKDLLMKVKTENDILSFYKNEVEGTYVTRKGYYIEQTDKCHGCLSNKLLKACHVNSYTLLDFDRKIKKKQFCYSEHDKKVDGFEIIKYDDSCEFDKDRDRTILKRKVGGSTYFHYPDAEFADPSKWEKDTCFVIYKRVIVANNLTEEQANEVVEKMGDKMATLKAEAKEGEKQARKKKFVPEQLKHIKRTGPSNGVDENHPADGQMYLDTFGFAGGEFGNWMNETDRQASLNYGYDAFMDLADALNIDPQDISLGGELSIAFGSRGSAGAVAHYEPLRQVINLTKMHGAGSLAHEWGHALDNILSKKLNGSEWDTWLSDVKGQNALESAKELMNSFFRKPSTPEERHEAWKLAYISEKKKFKEDFTALLDECKDDIWNKYSADFELLMHDTELNKDKAMVVFDKANKDIFAASEYNLDDNMLNWLYDQLLETNKIYTQPQQEVETSLTEKTDFYKNSVTFDSIYSKESKGYWQSKQEMFARAFACYVSDKLSYKSDYLCGHANSSVAIFDDKVIKAFPEGEERRAINEKFDKLIGQLKELGLLHEQNRTQVRKKGR